MEYMIQMKREGQWEDVCVYFDYKQAVRHMENLKEIVSYLTGFQVEFRVVGVPDASPWISEELDNIEQAKRRN